MLLSGGAAAVRSAQWKRRAVSGDAAAPPAPGQRPSPEQCSRTLVDIAERGTLSTTTEDGWPMGTHCAYLLDGAGQPLLRLRADALHTAHVGRDARCSLYVQPFTQPGGVASRATLLGRAEAVVGAEADVLRERFTAAHAGRTGVDAVAASDLYFRLLVERVLFVGGLGSDPRAEVVSGEAYRAAAPDPLRRLAPLLVAQMNEERPEDVARFCEAAGCEGAVAAQLLWLDRWGFDARAVLPGGGVRDVRVAFTRGVEKEQEAVSQLTLLAQQLWERERAYKPAAPLPVGDA